MTTRIATAVRISFMASVMTLLASAPNAGESTGKGFPIRGSSQAPAQAYAPGSSIHSYNPARQTPQSAAGTEYQSETAAVMPMAPPAARTPEAAGTRAFEAQALSFPDSSRRREREDGKRGVGAASVWPALLTVMLVCGGFCGILVLAKKYLPGHRQLFAHPSMEVLGRTHIDPRRYVSLLRVGKRIIVVGVSPDEMRPLSEITDEDEITSIMEVARPKTEAGLSMFQKLFKKTVVDADAAETRAMAEAKARELDRQMDGLRRRVREIGGGRLPADGGDALDRIG